MEQQDRLALEFLSREFASTEAGLYDHIATSFRWVMATLFAANSGAVVALLNADRSLPGGRYPLGWFTAGMILSLVMGSLSVVMAQRQRALLAAARASVNQGLIMDDAEAADRALDEFKQKAEAAWWRDLPTYAGLCALICFIVGVLIIALS
jgi:hypothetical protein